MVTCFIEVDRGNVVEIIVYFALEAISGVELSSSLIVLISKAPGAEVICFNIVFSSRFLSFLLKIRGQL